MDDDVVWKRPSEFDVSAGPVADDDVTLEVVVVDTAVVSPRSPWLLLSRIGAVLAVAAAGTFAVSSLSGSPDGGASTPEELGLMFLTALDNEDVLGAVDVLIPGERDVFRDPLVDLISELIRLDVLSGDANLSRILGLEVDLADELVVVRPTNVADIVNVDLNAQMTVTVDGDTLPIGDLLSENLPPEALDLLTDTPEIQVDELDLTMTAVDVNGRWYFSVFHSIAEQIREGSTQADIPEQGLVASGAETPEAAFDQFLDALGPLDLTGLIEILNPGDAAALQRYAPMFLPDAESELADTGINLQVTDRQFRVEGSGSNRTVLIDAVALEGEIDGIKFSIAFADGCLQVDVEEESFEECLDQLGGLTGLGSFVGGAAEVNELGVEETEVSALVDTLKEAFSDMEETGVELRQVEGLWYVSPTATFTEGVLKLLRALDREELDAIIDAFPTALGAGIGVGLSEEESWSEFPTTSAEVGFADCYEATDAAAAVECFQSLLTSGDIAPAEVPYPMRFPECGFAEAWWQGDLYSMSDEEFTATISGVRECFFDLLEQGLIEPWELGQEITHFECFEGRNYYNTFDDPGFDQRWSECVSVAYSAAADS